MFKNYMQEVKAITTVLNSLGIDHEIKVMKVQKNFAKNTENGDEIRIALIA